MSDGKTAKAALADAVRELREEVARLRADLASHRCHANGACCLHNHCNLGHCWCWTYHGTFGAAGGALPLVYTISNANPAAPYLAGMNTAAGGGPTMTF